MSSSVQICPRITVCKIVDIGSDWFAGRLCYPDEYLFKAIFLINNLKVDMNRIDIILDGR